MNSRIKESPERTARARQATRYWTKKRREEAQPIPLRVAPEKMLRSVERASGRSKVVPATLPKSERVRAQTGEVTDMTRVPFCYVGKLFMREGNHNYVGSAWVIGNQAIFSAAHCLFDDNGTFFDDVVFAPFYRDGNSPETFAVIQSSIDERYADFGNDYLNYDLGIGILDRPIGHLTGIAGYAMYPTSRIAIGNYVTGIGYPAASPFDGMRMIKSRGRIVRDAAPGTHQERFFGAENDMTGGCSGGPWADDSNVIVGLNSFVFSGERPPIMHSPYFGAGFEELIEWAKDRGAIESDIDDDNGHQEFDIESVRYELDSAANAIQNAINKLN